MRTREPEGTPEHDLVDGATVVGLGEVERLVVPPVDAAAELEVVAVVALRGRGLVVVRGHVALAIEPIEARGPELGPCPGPPGTAVPGPMQLVPGHGVTMTTPC